MVPGAGSLRHHQAGDQGVQGARVGNRAGHFHRLVLAAPRHRAPTHRRTSSAIRYREAGCSKSTTHVRGDGQAWLEDRPRARSTSWSGAPDDVEHRRHGASTHRGIITWIYRRPPFPGLAPNTVVAFAARSERRVLRISTSPTLDSDVARGLQFSKVKRTADEPTSWSPGSPTRFCSIRACRSARPSCRPRSSTASMMQLPPHEEALFQEFVQTRETYGDDPDGIACRLSTRRSDDILPTR